MTLIEMKQKSTFRYLISSIPLLSLMLFLSAANAGNEAGPDKTTCLKPDGTAIPVQIGSKAVEGYCYYWEPSTGLDNWFSANPTASPAVTTTYTLYISGEDFSYSATDQVTVTVGVPENFSITPKLCCYKTGETLTPEMFEISPSGFEHLVSFFPPSIVQENNQMSYISTHNASFGCAGSGIYQISLTAVDENITNEVGVQLPPDILSLDQQFIEKIEDALEKLFKFIKSSEIIPCEPEFSVSNNISAAVGMKCCNTNDVCTKANYKISFNPQACGSLECNFPFFGIPYLASVNVAISSSICSGVAATYETGCEETPLCFSMSPQASIGGGISGTVLSGAAFSASTQVVGSLSVPDLQICYGSADPPKGTGNYCVKLDVVGEVKLLSFITKKVSRNIIPEKCGNPFI